VSKGTDEGRYGQHRVDGREEPPVATNATTLPAANRCVEIAVLK
jgi:hypothetical protein